MTKNPINLAVRFLLELAGIFTYGLWGYSKTDEFYRFILMILLPLLFAVLWGVFAVRDDPSRSGKTVVQTPGFIRLLLELGLFSLAIWMLSDLEHTLIGWLLAMVVIAHYLVSKDRVRWLLSVRKS